MTRLLSQQQVGITRSIDITIQQVLVTRLHQPGALLIHLYLLTTIEIRILDPFLHYYVINLREPRLNPILFLKWRIGVDLLPYWHGGGGELLGRFGFGVVAGSGI